MSYNSKSITRKAGAVAIIHVEVLVAQKRRLIEDCEKYRMTQGAIIEAALQLWHSTAQEGP